jgi:hypothetical protein
MQAAPCPGKARYRLAQASCWILRRVSGVNPGHLSDGVIAAELTNHLIEGVVLTPGMVVTIPELQRAGFYYVT